MTPLILLKIPTVTIPWPSQGLRRISVNSFGFGGTNAHVVLDDAFHYLQEKGVVANHCSVSFQAALRTSPSISNMQSSNTLVRNRGSPANKGLLLDDLHAGKGLMMPGHYASRAMVAKTAGHLNNNTLLPHSLPFQLLVWTAADEGALKRVVQRYDDYLHLEGQDKIKHLPFTLATKRNHLPWRSFAVVDSRLDLQTNTGLSATTPTRASSRRSIAFIFTGQGAQYTRMGFDLVRYPVFQEALQQVDNIYSSLGCEWSVFGKLSYLEKSILVANPDRRTC